MRKGQSARFLFFEPKKTEQLLHFPPASRNLVTTTRSENDARSWTPHARSPHDRATGVLRYGTVSSADRADVLLGTKKQTFIPKQSVARGSLRS